MGMVTILSCSGVWKPLLLMLMKYKNVLTMQATPQSRHRRLIMVLGFRPSDYVFHLPEVEASLPQLKQLDHVLMDRRSRPEFGPRDRGVTTEIGAHKVILFSCCGFAPADVGRITGDQMEGS